MITLGIDSSTQGTKAVVLEVDTGKMLASASVNYGADLPEFGAPNGYIVDPDPRVCRADPRMWVRGLELVLARLQESGAPMSAVAAIGGGAQQHAVILLDEQGRLSFPTAHIWMDASTDSEVAELDRRFGSELAERTGSVATARFAAAQLMKFSRQHPEAWLCTTRVHLLSSYLASVLSGADAPIELGDGAGMNLLNLKTCRWDDEICDFVADGLREKLPAVSACAGDVGLRLDERFARFGLRPGIPVVPFTGDNPAAFIGTGARVSGDAVMSLGTSDTLTVATDVPRPDIVGRYNVLGNPFGGFLSLVCVTNGSLARDRVRRECGVDWRYFDETAWTGTCDTSEVAFPYYVEETAPRHAATGIEANFDWLSADSSRRIRAVVEGQIRNLHEQSRGMGEIRSLRVVGGASKSPGILSVVKRVFGVPVIKLEASCSVAVGGAIIAGECCQ